ncbi:flavoprotein, partial [Streptomyces sp. NPDC058272]
AAERVELTLPETGVCGGAGLFDEPETAQGGEGGGCCATPTTLQIGIGAPVSPGGC